MTDTLQHIIVLYGASCSIEVAFPHTHITLSLVQGFVQGDGILEPERIDDTRDRSAAAVQKPPRPDDALPES